MSDWIMVTQQLPVSKMDVLVFEKDGTQSVARFVPECTCEKKWHGSGRTPLYWMPLPEPPK